MTEEEWEASEEGPVYGDLYISIAMAFLFFFSFWVDTDTSRWLFYFYFPLLLNFLIDVVAI